MDEVPGKKLQADASSHDVTYCQPCSQDGETFLAEAYCTVCNEFMCSICTKVHKKQRITKSHSFLDKSSMPTSMRQYPIEEERTEPCDIHPGEFIKYFCPTHQALNCGHCSVLNHKSCKQQIISEIAKAFNDGPGYEDIKQVFTHLLNDIDACASDIEDNVKLVEKLSEREITKLREYRNQVNKYFDEREKVLLNIITQMKTMNKTPLDILKPKCNKLKTQVKEIKQKLEAQAKNTCQLFIEAQKAKNLLEGVQSTLAEIKKEKSLQHYQFRKDPVTEMVLASRSGLGSILMGTADQRCERANFTKQDKGKTNTTSLDADIKLQVVGGMKTSKTDVGTNVEVVGDIQVDLTQNISANATTLDFEKQKCTKQRKIKKKGKNKTITSYAATNVQEDRDTQFQYRHPDLAISDVLMALGKFSYFIPKAEEFVFNDCITKTLLQLDGTLIVRYKDGTHHISIVIWLVDTHPYNPPIVYVQRNNYMKCKTWSFTDTDGKIDVPYLREWKYPYSDLYGMIERLTVVFEEESPVFSQKIIDAMMLTYRTGYNLKKSGQT